ncbi:hypothetical protein [Streptomyces litmocidini]|uniref:hypothetical protein n=1 Tax=Streptomyces litmocidini TaxID=67318 RepID=UPI0036F4F48B
MRHPFSATAVRTLLAAVLTASAATVALAPAAAAEVLVDDFGLTHTDTFTAPLGGCLPADLLGTATVTEHSVNTPSAGSCGPRAPWWSRASTSSTSA